MESSTRALLGCRSAGRSLLARRRRIESEPCIQFLLFLCSSVSMATTVGIILVLAAETLGFFREVSPADFLTGTRWTPLFHPRAFGVLPLVAGTFLVTAVAAAAALPLGLGGAVYLSEYASERTRTLLKPTLEVLAGIPSVVYGYLALTVVTPVLQKLIPSAQVFNAASAGVAVGVMILPLITSLCDEAFRAVPRRLREGAYALGATRLEVSTRIVLPAALSGVMAAFILALSRAIGETMAVALAAGSTPKLTLNVLESVQTMTAYIVQVSLGDTPAGTVEYRSIFAVGAALFAITLAMNILSDRLRRRFREVYE